MIPCAMCELEDLAKLKDPYSCEFAFGLPTGFVCRVCLRKADGEHCDEQAHTLNKHPNPCRP